jgi:hypothetical protein
MNGGAGNDTFVFASGFGNDRIQGFDANPADGQDLLDVSAHSASPPPTSARRWHYAARRGQQCYHRHNG